MTVTVFKRMIINDLFKGKFSLELIERRTFKNDTMASSAIKSYVFIGKHIGLWFTQRESGFCTRQIHFFFYFKLYF